MTAPKTLYQRADEEFRSLINVYLALAKDSKGLTALLPEHLADKRARIIVMAGLGIPPGEATPEEVHAEWQRRQALTFDLETAITTGVYTNLRTIAEALYEEVMAQTNHFTRFDPDYLVANPHILPLMQHLGGVFSKAKLKERIGSVSDKKISRPAAERLCELLAEKVNPRKVVKDEILIRLSSTIEGIVRDLVGRVLLESIVAAALMQRNLSFLREGEYAKLPGVVYDFRADFVLPDATAPKAFIEVRKSSSRHASLYAKDKMFSAINWKGKKPDLLGALVVDGEWTRETLRVMSGVFDYVIPIGRIDELIQNIEAYLAGDLKKLKWLIEFRITPAPSE